MPTGDGTAGTAGEEWPELLAARDDGPFARSRLPPVGGHLRMLLMVALTMRHQRDVAPRNAGLPREALVHWQCNAQSILRQKTGTRGWDNARTISARVVLRRKCRSDSTDSLRFAAGGGRAGDREPDRGSTRKRRRCSLQPHLPAVMTLLANVYRKRFAHRPNPK